MINALKEGISKNFVSLMLCISIIASCMYVYDKENLGIFVLITFIIQTSVFSFYTYLSKKSMILRFISVLGSFFAICALVTIAIKNGQNKSNMDFFIWFLSPQALVKFSMSYIIATFIVINFFIASTVYYFSAVRYRISMTFLITLIPFAFYRKEGESVPVLFAMLLLVMYVALMIHCRNVNTKENQKMITDTGYRKSIIYFLAFSSFLAFIIPKPNINIDNSWVDSIFESDSLTKYMLNRLGIVSETASSSVTYTDTSNIKLYEFICSEEPINLKSQTYSNYDYDTNIWTTSDCDMEGYKIEDTDAALLDPAIFYKAVSKAASLDTKFAQKYSLSGLSSELSEDYKRKLTMTNSVINAKYYFTPVLSYNVNKLYLQEDVYKADNGMLFSMSTSGKYYDVYYYSDISAYTEEYMQIIKSLNIENYGEFLDELLDVVLSDSDTSLEYYDVVCAYIRDFDNAEYYSSEFDSDVPYTIKDIAQKIVSRYNSDFERVYAVQEYFKLNDYLYDLTYQKPDDYNMEYFLTEGKKGICSDYATAMVILLRSVGIPARYAEGIHLHDADPKTGKIIVRDSDLHAFPEAFISGYGWMSFEPTQLEVAEKSSYDTKIMIILICCTLALIIFILLFSKYIMPVMSETLFNIKVKKSSDEKKIELILNRIRKKLKFDDSLTSNEISDIIISEYGIDMGNMATDFDAAVYGNKKVDDDAASSAIKIYEEMKEKIFRKGKK